MTADEAAEVLAGLADATWALAAAVDILSRPPQDSYATDDHAARVLAALGLLVPDGAGLVPTPGFGELMETRGAAFGHLARSAIGQVAAATRQPAPEHIWSIQDDETLLAQGTASARGFRLLVGALTGSLAGLSDRLSAPGARYLDTGVGVAGGACAVAEHFPSVTVVGLDPFDRALRLAHTVIAEHGFEDRIELRQGGVEELEDIEVYDAAWIPAPFVPPAAFAAGIPRLHRALKPGGWLIVAMGRLEGDALTVETTRWQNALLGGTPLTPAEAEERLTAAGFVDFVVVPTPPVAPVLVGARRSEA